MSKTNKLEKVRTVPTWSLLFTPGHRWQSRKLLRLVPYICRHGQSIAVAVDRNVIIDGNDVVHVLQLLQREFVEVIEVGERQPREVYLLRLSTCKLPYEFLERKEVQLQLD
jgi:hypothetical protein